MLNLWDSKNWDLDHEHRIYFLSVHLLVSALYTHYSSDASNCGHLLVQVDSNRMTL